MVMVSSSRGRHGRELELQGDLIVDAGDERHRRDRHAPIGVLRGGSALEATVGYWYYGYVERCRSDDSLDGQIAGGLKRERLAGFDRGWKPAELAQRKGDVFVLVGAQDEIVQRTVARAVIGLQGSGVDDDGAELSGARVVRVEVDLAAHLVGRADHRKWR